MDADPGAESRAFAVLGSTLATNPDGALQRVAECALCLCRADGAAINCIESLEGPPTLRWHAVAGDVAISAGDSGEAGSPLADLLQRNELTRIDEHDPRFASLPVIDSRTREMMVVPWSADGALIGTICVTGNSSRSFDNTDARRLQTLASYASAAWQLRTARAGTEHLLNLFRQAPGFMAILRGPDHVFELYNDSFTRLVGPRDLVGHRVRDVFPEVEGQGYFDWLDKVYRSGGAHLGHATPLRLHAEPGGPLKQLFVDFIYQAITDSSGRTTGIFVEGHDVTERVRSATALKESEARLRADVQQLKQMQDRQALLVSELQHRTRNLIAVVRSIAEQTLSTSTSLQEFGSAFDDRLAALGRVQALLSRTEADPITIETLIRMELDSVGAFGTEGRAISLGGPHVPLQQSIVQTLALALHELATNARKHGALATDGGVLKVRWSIADRNGKGALLRVHWVEEGRAAIAGPASPAGFGRYLLERALPYLGAATHFALDANGARCDIEVPLAPRPDCLPRAFRSRESGFS